MSPGSIVAATGLRPGNLPNSVLPNLSSLDLQITPVTDLSPLTKLQNLSWLSLWHSQPSDEEVAALQGALPDRKIVR